MYVMHSFRLWRLSELGTFQESDMVSSRLSQLTGRRGAGKTRPTREVAPPEARTWGAS